MVAIAVTANSSKMLLVANARWSVNQKQKASRVRAAFIHSGNAARQSWLGREITTVRPFSALLSPKSPAQSGSGAVIRGPRQVSRRGEGQSLGQEKEGHCVAMWHWGT